jgi:hypothetical protein
MNIILERIRNKEIMKYFPLSLFSGELTPMHEYWVRSLEGSILACFFITPHEGVEVLSKSIKSICIARKSQPNILNLYLQIKSGNFYGHFPWISFKRDAVDRVPQRVFIYTRTHTRTCEVTYRGVRVADIVSVSLDYIQYDFSE